MENKINTTWDYLDYSRSFDIITGRKSLVKLEMPESYGIMLLWNLLKAY